MFAHQSEQRNALSRTGTLRRGDDHQSQRSVFPLSRTNKRNREVITEIVAELIRRGEHYQPIVVEEKGGIREEGQIKQETAEPEEDCIIIQGDNLPIVDLPKYNTDRNEAKYKQINHIVGKPRNLLQTRKQPKTTSRKPISRWT